MTANFTTPTYNLTSIKEAFNCADKLRITRTARQGAMSLGMDDNDIVNAIQSITAINFHKTMPSENMPHLPHFDVYRITWNSINIYTKFQDIGAFMVVSFKRDESR